jgi:twitching motility two-component system response regulator PilH
MKTPPLFLLLAPIASISPAAFADDTIERVRTEGDARATRCEAGSCIARTGHATLSEARTGIARARELRPDLILMDVVMPGTNGYQATRALSRDDATKDIPVILCTTKNQETDKIWGMRQGARDYVTKPVNHGELLAKIAAL